MNFTSSRSHLFVELSIKVERRAATGGLQVHRGKLTIIDLAGSERIVTNNPQLNAESRSINMSLSYLSQVFQALSSESELIVYRNCTLTKLLANKLRRDTNTLLLATVSAKEGKSAPPPPPAMVTSPGGTRRPGKAARRSSTVDALDAMGIERKTLESNPILEAGLGREEPA